MAKDRAQSRKYVDGSKEHRLWFMNTSIILS